jgi:hypothetical protein
MVARRGERGCGPRDWLIAATMTATAATFVGVLSVSDDSQADGKNGNSCQTKFDGCSFHRVFFVINASSRMRSFLRLEQKIDQSQANPAFS